MKGDSRLLLCHSSETPLHNKRRDLLFHLAGLWILHGGPGKNCEDFGQTSIAVREKQKLGTTTNSPILLPGGETRKQLAFAAEHLDAPDPDLAPIKGEVLAAVGLNGDGLDGSSVGAAGWFGEAKSCHVLTWTTGGHTQGQLGCFHDNG